MPSETKALFLHAPREGLRAKTYILLFTMIVFGPLGDVLLGKGMRSIGAMDNLVRANVVQLFFRAFSTRTIWLGIFSLSIFFVAYILVLSWADFSYVQPASAMSYGLITLLAYFVLHEKITPTRWVGVLLICVGVFVVGDTQPRTTEHNSC
jgi:uncharacterized membrane protein